MYRIFMVVLGGFMFLISFPHHATAVSYYTEGHSDYRFGIGDMLNLYQYLDGYNQASSGAAITNGEYIPDSVYMDPAEVVTAVPESTRIYAQSQGGASYTVAQELGIEMGADYWFAPQSTLGGGSAPALHAPYLGFGAEEMTMGVFNDNHIECVLQAMSGPAEGEFALSQSGSWLMSTANGITDEDTVNFYIPGHDHYKWYFSKPGVYELTFHISATRTSTGQLDTDEDTFTVLVGSTVWKGANGGNWSDSGNWVSGVPGYGSTVIFTTSSAAHQPLNQNIAEPLDLHGIIFTVNAGPHQLGGQLIRLSVDAPEISSDSPDDQEIGNPLDLAADVTVAVNGSGDLVLSGTVSGSGSLGKTGIGALVVSSGIDLAGDFTVSEGTATCASIRCGTLAIGGGSRDAGAAGVGEALALGGVSPVPVPEPHSFVLFAAGFLTLWGRRFYAGEER